MNSVLIAGGAGFIGASLVKRFKKLGYKVIVLVEKNAILWRLSGVMLTVEVVRVDFADFRGLREVFEHHKPSVIINTVSYGGLFNEGFSDKIYKINFEGPANLLRASVQVGFDSFITLGSSEEYGCAVGQISEEFLPRPINDYGVAKTMMTNFALKYAYGQGLPVYCIRPFTVYGDLSPKDKLIGSLFLGAHKGVGVVLRAPENERDFLYVDDLVDLILLVCQKRPKGHYLFNAGTGISHKVSDVVQKIKEMVPQDIRIEWVSNHCDRQGPKIRFADVTLAKKLLSWTPRYSLDEGIRATSAWFEDHYSLYESDECFTEVASSAL